VGGVAPILGEGNGPLVDVENYGDSRVLVEIPNGRVEGGGVRTGGRFRAQQLKYCEAGPSQDADGLGCWRRAKGRLVTERGSWGPDGRVRQPRFVRVHEID